MTKLFGLLERIKTKLDQSAFPNEAAVAHGIVSPILQALGWDPTEPEQVMAEFTNGHGRVDFALCTAPRRPAVFIEVKGVGRSLDGDPQLFECAFHESVPICVITDGREWNFYLPSGKDNHEERRVYRLLLDEKDASVAEGALRRYLEHGRVKSGQAREAANSDYMDQAAKRETARYLPAAWAQIVSAPEELLLELVADQVESLSGFRPPANQVLAFLRSLGTSPNEMRPPPQRDEPLLLTVPFKPVAPTSIQERQPRISSNRSREALIVEVLGEAFEARNGNHALVEVLGRIVRKDLNKVPLLAEEVRGTSRNHIARTLSEIYPDRPDLAHTSVAEFSSGWLIGLNIANREKVRIVRAACEIYGLAFGRDVKFDLPNA